MPLDIDEAVRLSKSHLESLLPNANLDEVDGLALTFMLEEVVSSALDTDIIYGALDAGDYESLKEHFDKVKEVTKDLYAIVDARSEYLTGILWGESAE